MTNHKIGDKFIAIDDGLDITKGRVYEAAGRYGNSGNTYFLDNVGDKRSVEFNIGRGTLKIIEEAPPKIGSKTKKIRITQAPNKAVWYANLVGAVVEVSDQDEYLYSVHGMQTAGGFPFSILKSDTEVVDN